MLPLLARFALAAPLTAPTLLSPADGGAVALDPTLSVAVAEEGAGPLTVTFHGRPYSPPGDDFTIIALPDTQYYACGCSGGSTDTFAAQTAWVAEQILPLNIAYVAQLGDCVEHGDDKEAEWLVADEAFAAFDEGRSPFSLPAGGLPYGVAVGNHDQSPAGSADGTTDYYNQYFGSDRFSDRGWYGGFYGSNYDNHYDLFEVGDLGFIVLYFEYDLVMDPAILAWADALLDDYPDRHAIVVSHYLLNSDGGHSGQGGDLYDALSGHDNLGLMLAGHVPGEARRSDEGARPVHTLLADYQGRSGGGDGWLRILTFSPALGQIAVRTYSPTLDASESDADSEFSLDWDASTAPWSELGAVPVVDGVASLDWAGLSAGAAYAWTATLSDGVETVSAGPWTFTAVAPEPDDTGADDTGADDSGADDTAPEDDTGSPDGAPTDDTADGAEDPVKIAGPDCGCASGGARPAGGLPLLALLLGLARRSGRRRLDRGAPAKRGSRAR